MSETITITQIVDAIKNSLKLADDDMRAQSGLDLGEGIADTPTLQVYWEDENTDAESANDRTTFGGGVQQSHITIHADVFVHERGTIGENMAAVQVMAEAVRTRLVAQKAGPFFGLEGIKSFKWRAERVTFEYAEVKYAGIRFTIEVRVY